MTSDPGHVTTDFGHVTSNPQHFSASPGHVSAGLEHVTAGPGLATDGPLDLRSQVLDTGHVITYYICTRDHEGSEAHGKIYRTN